MLQCWAHEPVKRPSFSELCETLESMNKEDHTYVNIDPRTPAPLPPTASSYRELLFQNPDIEHEAV